MKPFSIDGEATLDPQYRSLLTQPLDLQLEETHDSSATVRIHVPPLEVLQEGGLGSDVQVRAAGGSIALRNPEVDLVGIELDLDWSPASGLPRGRVEISRIAPSGRDPWLAPLTLRSEIAPDKGALTADMDTQGNSF